MECAKGLWQGGTLSKGWKVALVAGVEREGAVESSEGFAVRWGWWRQGGIDQNCRMETGLEGWSNAGPVKRLLPSFRQGPSRVQTGVLAVK